VLNTYDLCQKFHALHLVLVAELPHCGETQDTLEALFRAEELAITACEARASFPERIKEALKDADAQAAELLKSCDCPRSDHVALCEGCGLETPGVHVVHRQALCPECYYNKR